jgi:phosphoglycolate phosphatase-like HAD superfamily hydrolase
MLKIDKAKIKCLLFDFDGVILDSLDVKTKAFYNIYKEYGQGVAEKVVEHHLMNGGISRFKKFYHYHKTFLGKELSESEHDHLCLRFSDEVISGVVNSDEVKGAWNFIKSANSLNITCHIITGTPTNEMELILSRLGARKYFNGVFGSPTSKNHWVRHILENSEYSSDQMVFFGDAETDREAALSNNIFFFLRRHEFNGFIKQDEFVFEDFDSIKIL